MGPSLGANDPSMISAPTRDADEYSQMCSPPASLSPERATAAPCLPRGPSKMSRKVWPSLLWNYCFSSLSWGFPGGSASLVDQLVKNLTIMQETWVQSLGWEDSLEKEITMHSNILAWKIPWTEEPGRLQSIGLQRVRHDWAHTTLITAYEKSIFISLFQWSFQVKHKSSYLKISIALPFLCKLLSHSPSHFWGFETSQGAFFAH